MISNREDVNESELEDEERNMSDDGSNNNDNDDEDDFTIIQKMLQSGTTVSNGMQTLYH